MADERADERWFADEDETREMVRDALRRRGLSEAQINKELESKTPLKDLSDDEVNDINAYILSQSTDVDATQRGKEAPKPSHKK